MLLLHNKTTAFMHTLGRVRAEKVHTRERELFELVAALLPFFVFARMGQVRQLCPSLPHCEHVTVVLRGLTGHERLLWPGWPH